MFDEKMQSLALFLVAAAAVGPALAQDCPFYPGTCPVNVDNVVEVIMMSHTVLELRNCPFPNIGPLG